MSSSMCFKQIEWFIIQKCWLLFIYYLCFCKNDEANNMMFHIYEWDHWSNTKEPYPYTYFKTELCETCAVITKLSEDRKSSSASLSAN